MEIYFLVLGGQRRIRELFLLLLLRRWFQFGIMNTIEGYFEEVCLAPQHLKLSDDKLSFFFYVLLNQIANILFRIFISVSMNATFLSHSNHLMLVSSLCYPHNLSCRIFLISLLVKKYKIWINFFLYLIDFIRKMLEWIIFFFEKAFKF